MGRSKKAGGGTAGSPKINSLSHLPGPACNFSIFGHAMWCFCCLPSPVASWLIWFHSRDAKVGH